MVVPLVLLSIPMALGIHTVTAFLYNGFPSRPFWNASILAPRFIASAFIRSMSSGLRMTGGPPSTRNVAVWASAGRIVAIRTTRSKSDDRVLVCKIS